MQGTFFVTSVYLQEVRGYNAIQTGLMLTPATIGILISSARAERFAQRHSQRWLVIAGFAVTVAGMALLLALVRGQSSALASVPGLLLIGFGVGAMLTSSVNIVQSSFPDRDQSDISGLSRSVSNLGSSLGTALAGSILVAAAHPGGRPYARGAQHAHGHRAHRPRPRRPHPADVADPRPGLGTARGECRRPWMVWVAPPPKPSRIC